MSTEIRIGEDDKPYLIDFTARAASPPSEMYQELWENFGQIIWHGSNGELIDPVPIAKYGAQLILKSDWVEKDYLPVKVPNEISRWIKWKNLCRTNGQDKVIPMFGGMREIGSAVGLGETMKEAATKALDHAKQVKGVELKFDESALGKIVEEIDKGQQEGIEFSSEPLPEVAEVS
jgi:hypothetical protein